MCIEYGHMLKDVAVCTLTTGHAQNLPRKTVLSVPDWSNHNANTLVELVQNAVKTKIKASRYRKKCYDL